MIIKVLFAFLILSSVALIGVAIAVVVRVRWHWKKQQARARVSPEVTHESNQESLP